MTAIAAVGVLLPREAGRADGYEHARLFAWLTTLAMLVAFGLVAGHGLTGLWRGIFIDTRNRVALSRVQVFAWTAVVLSAFLSGALGNIGLGAPAPLKVDIPNALWLAMGLSTASFVVAPVARRRGAGSNVAQNRDATDSSWSDILQSDDDRFAATVDLSKIQLVFFTIVLLLVYAVAIGNAFDVKGQVIEALPATDEGFLILLAISQGGYLVKKALPPSAG